jgi:hypothetical protein
MFRFSIRELMLVTAIAGIGLSCFLFWARECEARRESEVLKAKMALMEQHLRFQGFTINNNDGKELALTHTEAKIRSTTEYIDVTLADGSHGRVVRGEPEFPKPQVSRWEPVDDPADD